MNGRILRLGLGGAPGRAEVFSQVPISSGLAGDWMKSMWNDLVFDKAGNLYVPDDKPRIWRVVAGRDRADLVHRSTPDGLLRLRRWTARRPDRPDRPVAVHLDHRVGRSPAGVVDLSHPAGRPSDGIGPRARPRVPVRPGRRRPPQATGLAFAKSGNLYVSLIGPNQIAVLDPAGDEIGRISSPLFHSPWGLAFSGKSLLVTNGDLEPADNPDAWKIFKVYVGETGLPLNRPKT